MTLQEKLDKFKTSPVGFHIQTEEIACRLGEILDKCEDIVPFCNTSFSFALGTAWGRYGNTNELYVSYNNANTGLRSFGYGTISKSGSGVATIYKITTEELIEYTNSQSKAEAPNDNNI